MSSFHLFFFCIFLVSGATYQPILVLKRMGAAEARRAKVSYHTLFRTFNIYHPVAHQSIPDLEPRPWAGVVVAMRHLFAWEGRGSQLVFPKVYYMHHGKETNRGLLTPGPRLYG